MTPALPLRRRLGYGVGDFAFNLFFTTASLYLLYYYTDVLGLPPATAGWIFAAPMIWDAVADPVMGYLASRTRSRWGRYRPYLLFGTVPLAASWMLMFAGSGLSGSALVLFALATHMLFRTLYTVVSMPYLSLSAVMTPDSGERGVLASFRMVAATASGLFVAFSTLKLAALFGGGDSMRGFLYVAILYGALATLILGVVFTQTIEAVRPVGDVMPSPARIAAMLRRNRPFWLIAGSLFAGSFASTLFGNPLPYLFKYELHRPDLIGPALGALTACALVSIPVWTALMKRSSKRIVSLAGTTVSIGGWLMFLTVSGTSIPLIFAAIVLLGVGFGSHALTFWAMIPDTVEYGEWRSGVRAEGMVFGLISFVQKAALGVSVGVLGELLGAVGYVANRPQTPDTLHAIRLLMTVGPIGAALIGAAFVFAYPLDHRTHGRLIRILARRARAAPITLAGGTA